MKKSTLLLSSTLLLLTLAGCGSGDSGSAHTGGTTGTTPDKSTTSSAVTSLSLQEFTPFDMPFITQLSPALGSSEYGALFYLENMYETLIRYENGEYLPGLAKSWEISEDLLSYTFQLEEEIVFSDGTPMNAEAVKANFDALPILLGDYAGAYGMTSGNVASADVVDEYTVTIHLYTPYYGTLFDLTLLDPHGIVSPTAFGEDFMPVEEAYSTSFGTGPYMFAGDLNNGVYTFVRNPNYRGDITPIETFTVTTISDSDTAALALRDGQIDMLSGAGRISFDAASQMESDPNFKVVFSSGYEQSKFLALNTTKFPFDDVTVRNAVSLGLDKQSISDVVYYGYATPSSELFPSTSAYCSDMPSSKSYDFEAAIALLEENGYVDSDGDGVREKDGTPLVLTFPYDSSSSVESTVILLLKEQLTNLGFQVDTQALDMMSNYMAGMEGNFHIAYAGTYGPVYDPFSVITNMISTNFADPYSNRVGASNPEMDQLLTDLFGLTEAEDIEASYLELFNYISESDVLIPVVRVPAVAVFDSSVISDYHFPTYTSAITVANIVT